MLNPLNDAPYFMSLFPLVLLGVLPNRIFTILTNETLIAVPLFIFMGVLLEKTNIASKLLTSIGNLFGTINGGLGIGVIIVGMLFFLFEV